MLVTIVINITLCDRVLSRPRLRGAVAVGIFPPVSIVLGLMGSFLFLT